MLKAIAQKVLEVRKNLLKILSLFVLVIAGLAVYAKHSTIPAAEQIAFISNRNGRDRVYLMEHYGTRQRPLISERNTEESYRHHSPVWSPEGFRIAYVSDVDMLMKDSSIHIYDFEKKRDVIVEKLVGTRSIQRMWWSYDGQCIYWTRPDSMLTYQYTSPVMVDEARTLSCDKGIKTIGGVSYWTSYLLEEACSPNGIYCLKLEYQPENRAFITYLSPSSGTVTHTVPGILDRAAWTSDSTHLAFTVYNFHNSIELYVVQTAESIPCLISTGLALKFYSSIAWSPDARWIAFSAKGLDGNVDIYKVEAKTGEIRRLTTDPANDSDPVWQPGRGK